MQFALCVFYFVQRATNLLANAAKIVANLSDARAANWADFVSIANCSLKCRLVQICWQTNAAFIYHHGGR